MTNIITYVDYIYHLVDLTGKFGLLLHPDRQFDWRWWRDNVDFRRK